MHDFKVEALEIGDENEGDYIRYAAVITRRDFPHEKELGDHLINRTADIVAQKNSPR